MTPPQRTSRTYYGRQHHRGPLGRLLAALRRTWESLRVRAALIVERLGRWRRPARPPSEAAVNLDTGRAWVPWRRATRWLRRSGQADAPGRRFNRRFALTTTLAALAALAAAIVWQRVQAGRQTQALLARAEQWERQGEPRRAAEYRRRYLALVPDDLATRRRLAQNLDAAADSPETERLALEAYLRVLAGDARDLATAERVAELYWQGGQLLQAERQAAQVLRVSPDSARGLRIQALVAAQRWASGGTTGTARTDDAASAPLRELLQIARQASPANRGDEQLATALAELYRATAGSAPDDPRRAAADAVLDDLVAAAPRSVSARLARHAYRLRHQATPAAEAHDLRHAHELEPDNPRVLQALAEWSLAQAAWTDAAEAYLKWSQAEATAWEAALGYGEALARGGETHAALVAWREGAARYPRRATPFWLRVAETQLAAGALEECEHSLAAADEALPRFPQATVSLGSWCHLVRARLHIACGEFAAALPLVRQLATSDLPHDLAADPQRRVALYYDLARCHLALEQLDAAAEAFAEAFKLEPDVIAHAIAAGRARLRAGAGAAADDWSVLALNQAPDSAEAWLFAAQCRLANARGSTTTADAGPAPANALSQVPELLARAEGLGADPTLVRLLESQALALSGQGALAAERLRASSMADPANEPLARAYLLALVDQDQLAEAEHLLGQYRERFGESPRTAQLAARLAAARGELPKAQALLAAVRATGSAADQAQLRLDEIRLALAEGRLDVVRRALEDWLDESPMPLAAVRLLAELAAEADDGPPLARAIERLRTVEGPQGLSWRYFTAERLCQLATGPADPNLAEAAVLAGEITAADPRWPPGLVLAGRVAELQGALDQALDRYEAALAAGENAPRVYQQAIPLAYRLGRIEAAERYLQRLQNTSTWTTEVAETAVLVSVDQGCLPRALALAEATAARNPDDLPSRLWLAQALALNRRGDDAERVLRAAIDDFPRDERSWAALLRLLVASGREVATDELLARLETSEALPLASRVVLQAQTQQARRHLAPAASTWRRAWQLNPDDAAVARQVAAFFATSDPPLAQAALRQVLTREPDDDECRRALARNLAGSNDPQDWREAQQLLADSEAATDRWLLAQLCAQRSDEADLTTAWSLLSALCEAADGGTLDDRLLLADVAVRRGEPERGLAVLEPLLTRQAGEPLVWMAWAQTLLAADRVDEALRALDRLEELSGPTLASFQLRARALNRAGDSVACDALGEQFVAAAPAGEPPAARLLEVARVAAGLELPSTEAWLRRAQAADPLAGISYADWLVGRGRVSEAQQMLLELAPATGEPRAVAAAIELALVHLTSEPNRATLDHLATTLVENPSADAAACATAGTWLQVRGQRTPALALLRRALDLDPSRSDVRNNLALLGSEDPDTQAEAERLLEEAAALIGRPAALIDTWGVLRWRQSRWDEAVRLFEEATPGENPDPMSLLHLAAAYLRQSRVEEARGTWARALARGLDPAGLAAGDREFLAELVRGGLVEPATSAGSP